MKRVHGSTQKKHKEIFLKKFLLLVIDLLLFIFFHGCATFAPAPPPAISKRPPTHDRFFKLLDPEVKKADVRDASSESVTHFPYLRNNRFLTFLGKRLEHNYQKELWAKQMLKLNLNARKKSNTSPPLQYSIWQINSVSSPNETLY